MLTTARRKQKKSKTLDEIGNSYFHLFFRAFAAFTIKVDKPQD